MHYHRTPEIYQAWTGTRQELKKGDGEEIEEEKRKRMKGKEKEKKMERIKGKKEGGRRR